MERKGEKEEEGERDTKAKRRRYVRSSSEVENRFLSLKPSFCCRDSLRLHDEYEQISVLELPSFPLLGLATALRFIEWAQQHTSRSYLEEHQQPLVSLPTGRTPEHFIHNVSRLLKANWESDSTVIEELKKFGIDISRGNDSKPDMKQLIFVQMDEFYPMNPEHDNSFKKYIIKHYIENFGMDMKKAMLMDLWQVGCSPGRDAGKVWFGDRNGEESDAIDLSLRHRSPNSEIEAERQSVLLAVDSYCAQYERKIRDSGGIGFWLGGIGPDGHIAFNCASNSDPYCTTRLTRLNYETMAAAAGDLGGIEAAKLRLAVTIGLGTITHRRQDVVAIVFAAGDAKAKVVRDAIEGRNRQNDLKCSSTQMDDGNSIDLRTPASALYGIEGARFYLTRSAASKLELRRNEDFLQRIHNRPFVNRWKLRKIFSPENEDYLRLLSEPIIDLALRLGKQITSLTLSDTADDPRLQYLIKEDMFRPELSFNDCDKTNLMTDGVIPNMARVFNEACCCIEGSLVQKIEYGIALMQMQGRNILHTAPHHDDIMLGYLPFAASLLSDGNSNEQSESCGLNNKGLSDGFDPDDSEYDSSLNDATFGTYNRPRHSSLVTQHRFSYGTSGFNAVTNTYTFRTLKLAQQFLKTEKCKKLIEDGYFQPKYDADNDTDCNGGEQGMDKKNYMLQNKTTQVENQKHKNRFYDEDVEYYLDGHASRNEKMKEEAIARRCIRIIADVYGKLNSKDSIKNNASHKDVNFLSRTFLEQSLDSAEEYVSSRYLGQKDEPYFQKLKGMLREFEADLLWGYHGMMPSEVVSHWRLGFYKGDLFTESPKVTRDVLPVLDQMRDFEPHYVSVALDPEGSGPDTHYKVLQVVAKAAQMYTEERDRLPSCDSAERKPLSIWGYRNVWFRFHPSEANIFIPVSLSQLSSMNDAFLTCFLTQREASFPSFEYDGPFSHWAQVIQAEQYQMLKTLLGRDFFSKNKMRQIVAARGFIFLREMNVEEFVSRAQELQDAAEDT